MDNSQGSITLGKDVWNVADGYTKFKILKWMIMMDKFEMIAIYGSEDIEEETELPPELIPSRRISGLKRLKDTLKLLFENVSFVIKKDSKKKFDELREKLEDVESVLGSVSTSIRNDSTKEERIEINESWFNACLTVLQSIKEEMNVPINDANLIFRKGSEINMDDVEREILFGG